jgi:hypothetical protein
MYSNATVCSYETMTNSNISDLIHCHCHSWWLADERNIVILCADSDIIHRIVACSLCYAGRYATSFEALHAYHLATHNRIMAEVLKRRVPPSEKRFLADFTNVTQADKVFTVPSLVCHLLITLDLKSQPTNNVMICQ